MSFWGDFGRFALPVAGIAVGGFFGAPLIAGATLGAWGLSSAALLGAGIGFQVAQWIDAPGVPEAPRVETRSPNYGFDTGRNTSSPDAPVMVCYGRPRVFGAKIYQGGEAQVTGTDGVTEYVDPSEVNDFAIGWGEGEIQAVFDVAADDVEIDAIEGAHHTYQKGTAAQTVDSRFTTLRHYQAFSSPGFWTFDPADHPPATPPVKTVTFSPEGDGATARLHLRGAMVNDPTHEGLTGERIVTVGLRYRRNSAGDWVNGGSFLLHYPAAQYGVVDWYVPIGAPIATDPTVLYQTVVGCTNYSYVGGEWGEVIEVMNAPVYEPTVVQVATDVPCAPFAGSQTHQIEITWQDCDKAADELISASLEVAGIDIEERALAQAFRQTAYSAITVPRQGLQSSTPEIAGTIAGRVISVWTGSAWVTRWSNNPVWCWRDLLLNSRYGGALDSSEVYDGADATVWGGTKKAAADCDAVVSTLRAAEAVTAYSTSLPGVPLWVGLNGWPTDGDDWGGYLAENQAGERLPIYYHDRQNRAIYLPAAFAAAPTSITIKEQRFRLDWGIDLQEEGGGVPETLLAHCRGMHWEDAGAIHVAVEQDRASSGDLDLPQIVELPGENGPVSTFSHWEEPDDQLPDTLIVRYWNPDEQFQRREVPVGANVAGGRVETRDFPGCQNGKQALRLGHTIRTNAKLAVRRCSFATPLSTLAIEPGDVRTIYHPLGGSEYGYDLTDPDAPVKVAGTGLDMMCLSFSDDPVADTRTYLFREHVAEAYSDDPGIALPSRVRDTRLLSIPPAVTTLTLTDLGDLTDDGVWNPELQADWIQPHRGTVAYWEVYESRSAGVEWRLAGTADVPFFRWRVAWSGTLHVRVIPVGVTGQRGAWADATSATIEVVGDVTPPANPVNLQISFTDRLCVIWNPPTEGDFDHYKATIDEWATYWVVRRPNAEVLNPSGREFVFRVVAVDRSGNESGESSIYCYLPQPAAPSPAWLILAAVNNYVTARISTGFAKTLGHTGFLFQWSPNAGATWYTANTHAQQSAAWTVPIDLFDPDPEIVELELAVRFAECDVFGASSWGDSDAVTAYKPSVVEVSGESGATKNIIYYQEDAPTDPGSGDLWYKPSTKILSKWSGTAWVTIGNAYDNTNQLTDGALLGETAIWASITGTGKPADGATVNNLTTSASDPSGGGNGDFWWNSTTSVLWQKIGGTWIASSDRTSTVIDGGLVTTGTIQLQGGDAVTKAGITATGSGDASIRFWAGETFANRATAPFQVTQGGDAVLKGTAHFGNSSLGYLVSLGKYLKGTSYGTGTPTLADFTDDGQVHVYAWMSSAWVELASIGLKTTGGDIVVGYFAAPAGKIAVYGTSSDQPALVGYATGAGDGVQGQSVSGSGVVGVGVIGGEFYGDADADSGVYGSGLHGGEFVAADTSGGNLLLPHVLVSDDAPSDAAEQGTVRMIEQATGDYAGYSYLWIKMTAGSGGWWYCMMATR